MLNQRIWGECVIEIENKFREDKGVQETARASSSTHFSMIYFAGQKEDPESNSPADQLVGRAKRKNKQWLYGTFNHHQDGILFF